MGDLEEALHRYIDFAGDSSPCTHSSMFGALEQGTPAMTVLGPCLDNSDAPAELNPDIGGIGVCSFTLKT